MIQRVRPAWAPEELGRIYSTPHDHTLYGRGHGERVGATIELAHRHLPVVTSVADLSCGNAAIARSMGADTVILGDYAPGYDIVGPIEETLRVLDDQMVDLFVLSETLEHLDNPFDVLGRVRDVAHRLLLSTPLEAWDDANGEHYWAWDRAGVEGLLAGAGWSVTAFESVDSREYGEPYLYGIWLLS